MSAQLDVQRRARARAVRLGFIGLGWIGRKRFDALAACEGIEVAALCDAVEAGDLEALLACDLDGVVIATPNACHTQQALACVARGLAVFLTAWASRLRADASFDPEALQIAQGAALIDEIYGT